MFSWDLFFSLFSFFLVIITPCERLILLITKILTCKVIIFQIPPRGYSSTVKYKNKNEKTYKKIDKYLFSCNND